MATWVWIVIAVVIVIVLVSIVGLALTRRRRVGLRETFGPEYGRTLDRRENRRSAETELRNRQKQRAQFTIHPLSEPARARYAGQWRDLQERFIDQPSSAVIEAEMLVQQVMGAEGYPVEDFATQSDVISVDHPRVVENYRRAHGVFERAQTQRATTEDMRTALLCYRSLFDELLATEGDEGAHRDEGWAAGQRAERTDGESR